MGFLKDMSELSIVVLSGDIEVELKKEDGASIIDLKEAIEKNAAAGKLKLEMGSVSSIDGDVVLFKHDKVSQENKDIYFETLKASIEYRVGVLNAVKDATSALLSSAD